MTELSHLDAVIDAINALRMAVKTAQEELDVPFGACRSVFMSEETAVLLFPVIANHLQDEANGTPKVWQFPFAGDTFTLVINNQLGDLIDAI